MAGAASGPGVIMPWGRGDPANNSFGTNFLEARAPELMRRRCGQFRRTVGLAVRKPLGNETAIATPGGASRFHRMLRMRGPMFMNCFGDYPLLAYPYPRKRIDGKAFHQGHPTTKLEQREADNLTHQRVRRLHAILNTPTSGKA